MTTTDQITIQVANKEFIISRRNLEKSSYFTSLLTNWNPDKTNKLTIDGDPKIFRHFINCCIYDDYYIPKKYVYNVLSLIKFYGLKSENVQKIVEEPQIPVEIWETKIFSIPSSNIHHTFTGKFCSLELYCGELPTSHGTIRMLISFNGKILLHHDIYDTSIYFSFVKDSFCKLKTYLIPNLELLNGNFVVEIKSLAEPPSKLTVGLFYHEDKSVVL